MRQCKVVANAFLDFIGLTLDLGDGIWFDEIIEGNEVPFDLFPQFISVIIRVVERPVVTVEIDFAVVPDQQLAGPPYQITVAA